MCAYNRVRSANFISLGETILKSYAIGGMTPMTCIVCTPFFFIDLGQTMLTYFREKRNKCMDEIKM